MNDLLPARVLAEIDAALDPPAVSS